MDVLNITCNNIKALPLNYCVLEPIVEFKDYKKMRDYKYLSKVYSDSQIEEAKNNPIIIHYAGELGKPWRRKNPPKYYQETIESLKSFNSFVYDKKTVVLSVLGTYINGLILDYFIFGQTEKKRVCILSKYQEDIRQFILHELHSGATIYEAYGAYNMQKQTEIVTIVDKNEYQKLTAFLNRIDPDAFITVYTVKEIQYKPKV